MLHKTFFLVFILLSSVIVCRGQISTSNTKKNVLYNILFISIDDLRTELNCYGASHIKSPNIDRLAAQGVRFENAHVQQAICMASRASIMTGIRPEKYGIYTCLLYTSPSPRDCRLSRMPSSA